MVTDDLYVAESVLHVAQEYATAKLNVMAEATLCCMQTEEIAKTFN